MFYGSKSNTKVKPKEPQRSPRILGLGLIKLDFYLNLTDEQIKKYNIDFSKINTPKDLAFITEDQSLLDLIQISSSDTLSNILLYLNKASIQKSFVELITLSPLRIHPDEEHMKKIFTHVTEHNYLFSNEMTVTSVSNKISFAIKNGKKLLKYFDIVTDYDPYTDDLLNDDPKKLSNENIYKNSNTHNSKNYKKEIKEIESYNDKVRIYSEKKKNDDDDNDILVRDYIYDDMSNHLEISRNDNKNKNIFDDDVNNKINEVHEEDGNSNQNQSINKTHSRKTNNNNEDNLDNISHIKNNEEQAVNQSENKSRITKKSKQENNDIQNEGENNDMQNEDENMDKENNDLENQEEKQNNDENKSNAEGSKILKTNSVKNNSNNFNESNNNKKEELDDFKVEDLEEMKDENFNNESHIKTHSRKNEKTNPSKKGEEDIDHSQKSKHSSYKFIEPYDKSSSNKYRLDNINLSHNSKNDNKQSKTSSKKLENSINLNEDSKKKIRPLYEQDSFKNGKLISGAKLVNIPAACEIEEYDYLFIDLEEFINFHTNGFPLYELAEFMKKISTSDKKPRIVLNYPNILINLNVVNLELLETIMAIMTYTDIFLFEKKECLAFFNMLNQMNYEKDLEENKLIDYFFKEIPHQKLGLNKLGLFLDEMQRFNIAEQKKDKIVNNLSYEINLYPKINHYNQKIVDEYKKIMTINNGYFKSIFFGGYFSSYIFNEDHYTSYFSGAESTKRILEIFKNKIDFPTNPEFYLIKIQKEKINKNLEKEKLKQKEEKFVLDCVNKTNSSIKYYNPLFDDNLNAFFASGVIRKQLKEKGFINTNGFVLYDSSYKAVLGGPPKPKKRLDTSERERHLLLAIKQNKELLSTDLQSFSKSLKGQSPTNRKLPLPNFDLNSSNLYISSKIKHLKTSKKKLKPIHQRLYSNTKQEKSPDKKNISMTKTQQNQNSKNDNSNSNQNNNNLSKSKNTNNHNTKDVLSTSLLKDKEDNYNVSKITSRNNSALDVNSDHEQSKNKSKLKTFNNSVNDNNRYSDNNENEYENSNNNNNYTQSKNHLNHDNNENDEENKESNLEKSKGKSNTSKNFHDMEEDNMENDNNEENNNEMNNEENKVEGENENNEENNNEMYNEDNPENQEGEEEEKKDAENANEENNQNENNLEEENMENAGEKGEEANNLEDRIEAEGKN